uniref:hypothetical protein n=1 Tax=Shewanella sp. TaxID=50422 RepID=UPI003D0E33DB
LTLSSKVSAVEKSHIDAAMKVYEVSMKDFTAIQAKQYALAIVPNATKEEQSNIADTILEVMISPEFALKYSEVISKFFSEEECLRLAEILKDPVLAKFRQHKLAYTQEVMMIAQEMLLTKLSEKS